MILLVIVHADRALDIHVTGIKFAYVVNKFMHYSPTANLRDHREPLVLFSSLPAPSATAPALYGTRSTAQL